MADSIQDLLHKKDFQKPDEVNRLKTYITEKYKDTCTVSISNNMIIVAVGNSSLAATLRMDLLNIKKKLDINQKIVIRTS